MVQPTQEQQRIVESEARALVVEAGAGAAKTTTLGLYASARPRARILYLAFSKAIQLEAAGRMPANVSCRTTHSIAWRKAIELFGDEAGQRVGKTYTSSVARAFRCGPLLASGALQAIQNWCGSLDEHIGPAHVPCEIAERLADPGGVVELARSVWARMQRRDGGELKLPHDGYLKLFQMDEPQLRGCDLVAVDEAQDLNMCTYDIVRRQGGGVVLVGDSAQQIFAFRGSANALRIHPADERLQLTRSFRFGNGVAQMANALLEHFKPDYDLRLDGGGPVSTRLAVDTRRAFAVLARTNAVVFEEAIAFLSTNRRYHFVGGTEGYRMEKLLDAYYLWAGDGGLIRDPYLRSFENFESLQQLAEDAADAELRHLVRVVEEYGARVPTLVDQIKSRHVALDKSAWPDFDGIFFSTAHKSKGLEFDQVWLADDFMRFFEEGRELSVEDVEQADVNLLYVALTRARHAVRLCKSFDEWLIYRHMRPH
jgi:F-box protein, helicase, 18